MGNIFKVYIRSIEFFIMFIYKNLFYQKGLFIEDDREVIICLNICLLDYCVIIYRRMVNQMIIRKVNDSIIEINVEDVRQLERFQLVKIVIKFLGEVINYCFFIKNEFICVRDYFLVMVMYENGLRLGLLEYVKNVCFEQVEFIEFKKCWILNVDEYKII